MCFNSIGHSIYHSCSGGENSATVDECTRITTGRGEQGKLSHFSDFGLWELNYNDVEHQDLGNL